MSIRELKKVCTNGNLVDAELLTDEQAGHCVCIYESTVKSAVMMPLLIPHLIRSESLEFVFLDYSTSESNLCSFEYDICRTKLETLME